MFEKLYKTIRLLKNKNKEPYSSLYKILGFYPDNVQVYQEAFLHKSHSSETEKGRPRNNERLEFLGDAILDAVVADILYRHFRSNREGFLTNTRSKIVQRETLNRVAVELGLDKLIVCSPKLVTHNSHIYGNALEALLGAIYLDKGYDCCYAFIRDVVIKRHIVLDDIARKEVNFKSSLIEWSQKNKLSFTYDVIETFSNNEGVPVFQTAVLLSDVQIGVGIGHTKKESQQNASMMAVKRLRTDRKIQLFVSDLKKKRTGEVATTTEFEELPEEATTPCSSNEVTPEATNS